MRSLLPSAAHLQSLRIMVIRCAFVAMVFLGTMTARSAVASSLDVEGSAKGAASAVHGARTSVLPSGMERGWSVGDTDPLELGVLFHHSLPLGVRDASSEEEEEERDDHVASGDLSVAGEKCLEPAFLRALDDDEGVAPTAVRFCLDARGPPAR